MLPLVLERLWQARQPRAYRPGATQARLAQDLNGAMPQLKAEPALDWKSARHPGLVLLLRAQQLFGEDHGQILPAQVQTGTGGNHPASRSTRFKASQRALCSGWLYTKRSPGVVTKYWPGASTSPEALVRPCTSTPSGNEFIAIST